ncbi:MAG: hypothetical protein H7123_06970 [Thermoleophilia bacterium]|nr:hypothetical protein [Thermoleophilia bacterium]
MRSLFSMLGGNSGTKTKSSLAENVRERRDDKSERAAAASAADELEGETRSAGDLRICAATGDPMMATEAQLDAERDVRRLRMVRRKANK